MTATSAKMVPTSEVVNVVCPCPFKEALASSWVAYSGDQRLNIIKVGAAEPQMVCQVHHGSRATCIAWSLQSLDVASPVVATGAKDKRIRVINASADLTVEVHEGHTGYINDCAFLGSGFLASTGDDHTLRVWDINKGLCVKVFNLRSAGRVLHYSPEEPFSLVCTEQRGVVQTFDLRHMQPSASVTIPVTDEPVMTADVCPYDNSRTIVAMGHRQLLVHRDGTIEHGGNRAAQTADVAWSRMQRDVFASRATNDTIHIHHCTQGSFGDLKRADGSIVTGSSIGWMATANTLVVGAGKELQFYDL